MKEITLLSLKKKILRKLAHPFWRVGPQRPPSCCSLNHYLSLPSVPMPLSFAHLSFLVISLLFAFFFILHTSSNDPLLFLTAIFLPMFPTSSPPHYHFLCPSMKSQRPALSLVTLGCGTWVCHGYTEPLAQLLWQSCHNYPPMSKSGTDGWVGGGRKRRESLGEDGRGDKSQRQRQSWTKTVSKSRSIVKLMYCGVCVCVYVWK